MLSTWGAGKNLKVSLNGTKLPVQTFTDYSLLFLEEEAQKVQEKTNERWEIVCALSTDGFQQVSFVNSINTLKGGTHVEHDVCSDFKLERIVLNC